jgi:hypothetical protein
MFCSLSLEYTVARRLGTSVRKPRAERIMNKVKNDLTLLSSNKIKNIFAFIQAKPQISLCCRIIRPAAMPKTLNLSKRLGKIALPYPHQLPNKKSLKCIPLTPISSVCQYLSRVTTIFGKWSFIALKGANSRSFVSGLEKLKHT